MFVMAIFLPLCHIWAFFKKDFWHFSRSRLLTFLRNLTLRFFNFFMLKVSYCAYDYMYFSKAFFMAVLYGFFKIGIFSRFLAFSKIKIFGFFQDFWHF